MFRFCKEGVPMKRLLRVFFAMSCLMLCGVGTGAIVFEDIRFSPPPSYTSTLKCAVGSIRCYRAHQEYLTMENF